MARPQRKVVSFIGLGAGMAPALLYSYLRAHPQVRTPKEPTNFFSSTKAFARGLSWYESQFNFVPGFVCGELTADYLQTAPAAALIAKHLPDARLIAVVENPLLAVRVAYVEARKNNLISKEVSVAEFLKHNPDVLMSARHGRYLAHYFSYYSPNDLFLVTADEVREEPIKIIKALFEHVGVNEKFVPLPLAHLVEDDGPDEKKKPGLIKRVIFFPFKIVARLKRWIWSRFQAPALPIEIAFDVARRIPLSPELETFLKNYYREDVAALSKLMHRGLSHEWGFDEGE
jgi:hypothetical protein